MTKEQQFFNALKNIFIGVPVEGESGYINLMRMKAKYFKKVMMPAIQREVEEALQPFPEFREELFDKLYTFFKRYFTQSGSIGFFFTPYHQSVYEQVYTNEQDVILFWKTARLYYVKTDRLFRSMEVPLDSFRFFFDVSALEHKCANEKRELVFEFKERRNDGTLVFTVTYSEKGKTTKVAEIRRAIKDALGLKNYTADVPSEETLEQAFRLFGRQSEVDYFICKDARSFLREQFDLWLWQYVLGKPGEESQTEWTETRIQQLKALKQIAYNVIDYIAAFEDELVKIWNKPKFVLKSGYVITLDRIAERDKKLLGRIVEHPGFDKQLKEWKELGMVDEKFTAEMLWQNTLAGKELHSRYRFLPLDTKYFKDLELQIIGLFDDLDAALDGWLIKSENYQALNTMLPKFRERVKCVYIDPPYNTGNDEFIYQNRYRHSSWLTMMENRLQLAREWMREDGVIFISIDRNERDYLTILGQMVFGPEGYLNTFVWINNLTGRQISSRGAAGTHEYVLAFGGQNVRTLSASVVKFKNMMPSAYKGFDYEIREDNIGPYVLKNELCNTNSKFNEETRPNLVFNIHYNFETGEIKFSDIGDEIEFEGFVKIPPKQNNDGVHRYHAWRWGKEKILKEKHNLEFVKCGDQVRIYTKVRDFEVTALKDVITDIRTSLSAEEISALFRVPVFMDYPKPVSFVEIFASQAGPEDFIADFFAGSGTTAHAVINLNREDGGKRKYILVEMADYFYTVLLPRIKKAVFSDKWRDGKAQPEGKGISHFVKYYELEQYEDVLRRASYADDADLFSDPNEPVRYLFLRDTKMLDNAETGEKVMEVDLEKGTVKVDLFKLYPDIDLAETLSNLTGKWIRRIHPDPEEPTKPGKVEFQDGTEIDLKNPDWRLIKPLIWW